MKNTKSIVLTLVLAFTAVTLSACGKVPGGYKGTFTDATTGTTVVLKGSKGSFSDGKGRKVETKSGDFKFETLIKGQAGIYIADHPRDSGKLEVFWLLPNVASRQEAGGLVWFQSEVIYSIFDKKFKDKLPGFDLTHCENGTLLLDPVLKTFQAGCGDDVQTIHLVRVK